MGGGGPYHICVILQSGGTGGAFVRVGDVDIVSGHGEADSGGTHVFFAAGDRETGKESTKYNLEAGRKKYHYEDASYS